MRLAVLTDRDHPALTVDDAPLLPELCRRGVDARPAVWDADLDWSAVDAVLVRSPWDYHLRWPAFVAWMDRVERLGLPTLNPLPLLRWNAEKTYLRELAEAGVPVTPTAWLSAGERVDLAALLDARGWTEVVVKPAVSAAGFDTVRARRDDLAEAQAVLDRRLRADAVLVQPFLGRVLDRGEQSLTFVDGELWGTVTKRAAPGGFPIHEEHGGTTAPDVASAAAREVGEATVAAVARRFGTPLYARVDLIDAEGGPRVVEVELLEPELFLRFVPGGHARFAAAVCGRLATLLRG